MKGGYSMKKTDNIAKQFDEYVKKIIDEAAEQYKKEVTDGTFLPLEERLKKQVACGQLNQAQADDMLELINKAAPKNGEN